MSANQVIRQACNTSTLDHTQTIPRPYASKDGRSGAEHGPRAVERLERGWGACRLGCPWRELTTRPVRTKDPAAAVAKRRGWGVHGAGRQPGRGRPRTRRQQQSGGAGVSTARADNPASEDQGPGGSGRGCGTGVCTARAGSLAAATTAAALGGPRGGLH